MMKFGSSLVEYERQIIEFERKRTILYLSKLCNQKVWINIRRKKQNEVISGIVKNIINGTLKKNKHLLLGGEFSINKDNYYSIDDIFAISFKPFSLEDATREDWDISFRSYILGNEAESDSDILFSSTDLKPQDFNDRPRIDELTGEVREFNTRYYEIIATALSLAL